ncbi:MAG TPA: hypothetical protein PK683_16785 [Leptospiraceae bacterium]|nr:hypothetical protein [Leptospiraceae bacterium]
MIDMNTLETYEKLKEMQFSEEQSKGLARLFGKYSELEPASKRDLSETELRLQKEIEGIRKETEDIRLEIQDVRLEIKNVEMKLYKEIEGTRLEIQDVRLEIKNAEIKLSKDIRELDVKLSVQMESIRSDLIRWFVGASIALGGLLGALIKFGK